MGSIFRKHYRKTGSFVMHERESVSMGHDLQPTLAVVHYRNLLNSLCHCRMLPGRMGYGVLILILRTNSLPICRVNSGQISIGSGYNLGPIPTEKKLQKESPNAYSMKNSAARYIDGRMENRVGHYVDLGIEHING